jgi:hypothetical protein
MHLSTGRSSGTHKTDKGQKAAELSKHGFLKENFES